MMEERHLHDKAVHMKSDNMFCSQTQNKKLKQLMMLSKWWASFSLPQTGATGAACGVRLFAKTRAATKGPGLTPCLTSLPSSSSSPACPPLHPHQPTFLSFLCTYNSVHFACQSGQIEKSEEGLINQQLHRKVNKKRWHHNGQWEHLFSEGRALQEQIQLSQHR